ncbi:TPA: exo-alpha-sialidase [Candidatus Poribacteria bacterium]|nr:exo-alpha-sialidase [Candidatus Poribacteria bacterium]
MKFNEIKYQDAATKTYLGSPSIIRLDNSDLLATHDYFGPGCPLNHEGEEHLTSVYRSSDDGKTWVNVTHIANAFWSGLFKHKGAIYLLGTSQQYGAIVIRRSEDNGNTWTHPRDEKTGLLFRGCPFREPPNYHCAPVPILKKNSRIYRAFEDCTPCNWGTGFQSLVISADEDAELLDASSWTMSDKIPYNPIWTPKEWGTLQRPGWLEGNIVETPNGEIWNILRFNSTPVVDKAAIIKVSDDGKNLSFDPKNGFIQFPGGMTKFTIRRDPFTQLYLTLSNNNTDPNWPSQRNVLSLHASDDLIHWRHKKTLMEDDSGLSHEESMRRTGFQYVDWQFDGDDVIYIVRVAYDGAHNFHDANRITFHKLENFRSLI